MKRNVAVESVFGLMGASTYTDAADPLSKLDAACSKMDAMETSAIREAAKKANMSVEDYLAQRKKETRGGLRETQKREMEI